MEQDHLPSVRHTLRDRGVAERGRESCRRRAYRGQHLSCIQWERVAKPPERKRGTSVKWTWMMSVQRGRGSLMAMGTAVLYYPWALLAEPYQAPDSLLGSLQAPKSNCGIFLNLPWHGLKDNIIQNIWECAESRHMHWNPNNNPDWHILKVHSALESCSTCINQSWTHSCYNVLDRQDAHLDTSLCNHIHSKS